MASALESARVAFARRAWGEAFAAFTEAASDKALAAKDHERRAISAYLIGADDYCAAAWEAAQRTALDAGDHAEAARYAFWLAFCFIMRGQMAHAGGWLGRAERLVADGKLDCEAAGYLLIPALLGALDAGEHEAARDLAVRATEIGRRFDDADLRAFGTLGHGQALLAIGDTTAGTAQLDEVMVSVTANEVGPITTGIVYCAVLLECMNLFDLPRASEWTEALSAWCDAQPDLVPYRGQCLVHRSQLQQATGDWPGATETAGAACARLNDPPHPALGMAHYQEAELQRLKGAFDAADAAYRQASRHGYQPMPGLALLQLARGNAAAAAASIERALEEPGSPVERAALLAAAADILRVTGDLAHARAAAEELRAIAARASSSAMLKALAGHAVGTLLVAEGDPAAALAELRATAAAWQTLRMPYEGARTTAMIGLACAALGDRTAAALEFDNARETFMALGADPDVQRLVALAAGSDEAASPPAVDGLSAREREVLLLIAAGKTNREIAAALVISPHTAGRHVENIFAKLGVTSRAAATAHGYEHGLI